MSFQRVYSTGIWR